MPVIRQLGTRSLSGGLIRERDSMSEMITLKVSMIWHDDDEGLIWNEIIAIGEDDENNPNDESIFYYVADMAELESLRDPANGEEWHIVEIDYEVSPLPLSGVWLI